MAGLKIAFLIFGAFLLTAQVESKAVNNFSDINIAELIKKIVHGAETVINEVLAKAETIVDNIDDDYVGVQNKVVNITKNAATKSLDKVNKAMNLVAEQANADGQKLIGCITSQESVAADIPANMVKTVTTCAEDEITNFVSDLTPLIKDLARTVKTTSAIADNLDNCVGDDTAALLCVIQVLGDVATAVIDDIPDIQANIAPVRNDLPDLVSTVTKCVQSSVPDVLAQLGNVVNSVASCNKA